MTYPLSQTQMGIYVTCMNTQEEGNYNIDMLYKLDDASTGLSTSCIDIERLAKALDKVIEAHPYVKSRLVTNDEGEVVFEDHSKDEFHTSIVEVNDIEDVRSHLGEDYDLMNDQLFRLEIYKTQKGDYLYVDFHHIIFDGMSFVNFTSEVARAYAGENLLGEEINGFDIAETEVALRQSPEYQTAKEWFQREYAEATEVESTPIPDVYEESVEHFVDTIVPLDIDGEQIAAFCKKQDVRESMLLTAAFGYMLGKYTADDKVLFNTIYHGRTDRRTRKSFCMMVQTLPVFMDMSKSSTVTELLGRLQTQVSTARNNCGYSYSEACSDLSLKSEVCFAYQGSLNSFGLTLDGRQQQEEYLYKHHPGIQISIRLVVENGEYKAKIDYPAHKYSTEMIKGMMESFCNIVAEMCRKDALSEIEICNKEQLAQLDSFNHPMPDVPKTTVLAEFQKAAHLYPDNIAAVFKDKKYTYAQLDELTDKIGALIYSKVSTPLSIREGLGVGLPVVSILIPRNEYMFILPLAAMKAGCAYQPLDPSYPQERLNFMVKDADAALLIADPELRDIVNEYEGKVLLTSELNSLGKRELPECPIQPSSLLILLYTSGSTGVPKGVMLEHHQVMAYVRWYQQNYKMTLESVGAAYASFGFDANMMDLYTPLTMGAAVCIIPEEIRLDLVALRDFMNDNGVTHAFMTTQVAQQFALNVDGCKTLKHLTMGGEKMMSMNPHPEFKLHNLYGPTECSVAVTHYEVNAYEHNIPIGGPTYTTTLKIVDKNFHRVPVGAAGELWINGPQVGRGYLNRPEKTAEAFVEHEGKRWYRTGDIVRYRQDGNIEFVGRKDGQVKIRGFRIELKEVEAVVRDFPGVKDVTVQSFDDPNGGKFIAAYVVSSDASLDTNALNAFILEQKPPYMVPAVTMQIDKIPLNVNQKVDKKALPKPELKSNSSSADAPAAPLNALERELYDIIAGIVNVSPLGESEGAAFAITDILGYIGLTSISGIKLATLIYKKYGVQVNAKTLAKTGTLQSIENEILQHWMRGDTADIAQQTEVSTISSPRGGREGAAPLSYSQMGVYTECMSNPDSVVYNIPTAITIPAGITVEQLKAALKTVVDAHPYINMHFKETENGDIVQCPLTDFILDISVMEMTMEEYEQKKQRFVRPFNLHEGPLYRFEIVVTESLHSPLSTLHLLCDFHHLIFDGGSMDTFLSQLCKVLDGANVEAETYDYYQFVKDQSIKPETEQFFVEQLGQIEEASSLIPDVFTPNLPHTNGSITIPTDFESADAMCKKLSVSTAAAYLAATFIAVSKFVAEETVGICTISNGRSNLKIAENFGMFVNTLPLVSQVDASMPTAEFIKHTAQLFADTIEHEEYPFSRVASQYGYAANIMFAYQVGVIADYVTKHGGLKLDNSLELDLAKFPVAVYINNSATQGAEIKVEYDKAMFSDTMMTNFGKAIDNALKGLISAHTIGDISITDESQWKVLDSYNNKECIADYHPAPTDTVLSTFQQMAQLYPDNVAAVFKDKKYTYKELVELTDKIGSLILSKIHNSKFKNNAEPVVSILIPRNEYMFILPLAAMKAGCAYQPLDPSYPQERLNFMVKDADAALLIADPDLRDIINEYEGKVILTSELENIEGIDTIESQGNLTPQSLFILLYTSGSTGVPKGVMLEHQNLLYFCHWYHRFYELKPEDNVAAYASFGFDACMMDMYSALTCGATVHIIPEEIRLDLFALNDYFEANNITHIFMTTQVGVQFLQNVDNHSLRYLSTGGEKLVSVDPPTNYNFYNVYGPTECTIFTTSFQVDKNEPNIPIGKPLDALNCYVMDKQLHRLPAGAAGELVIVGPQVGRGYLNRPDKTAEAFFTIDGQRAYHSGDIVRYREDGNIEFVGRKDGQVKIRGFRIELKEVEAVIRDFEGIRNVTVQAYDYEDGGKYIAAYIVSDQAIDINALNEFIKSQKPPYMVPAVTMQIDEIPLNVNQKVDKKALPKPEVAKAEYVAPKNDAEKAFCEIFEKVLGLKQVSATDDFFEIGGSSIIALKLVVAANKAGYDIVYNDVFDNTTPQMLAQFVSKGESKKVETAERTDASVTAIPEESTYIGPDGFDYRPLNALLKQNTLEAFRNGERLKIGDVLLTGATGFLGIHVLYDLITNYDGKIYCFVRPKGPVSGEKRLKAQLFYYFEHNYNALFGKRIFVVEGDATSEADMKNIDCQVDTVINCAACVKHFAKGNEIEKMNVGSVHNLILWCLEHNARLVHVSTGSVAGTSVNNYPPSETVLTEHMFYFGQNLDNQYAHSKFMAERMILDAILHHGLHAKIMRVGNLSARNVDGEFQINFRSNNFMNMLHAFQFMGVVPYSMQNNPTEFSPIDDTAHTILLLAQSPKACIVLHPFNVHKVLLGDVIRELAKYGKPIRMVENEEFGTTMQQLMEIPENIEKLRSLMAYKADSNTTSVFLGYNSSYTSQLLYRMDYCWPITTWDYVQRFIRAVGGMGMFEQR